MGELGLESSADTMQRGIGVKIVFTLRILQFSNKPVFLLFPTEALRNS